ncbi:MAG TPA: hypothetical protein VI542_11705 [Candidatus Tectomicrobia bacterium]
MTCFGVAGELHELFAVNGGEILAGDGHCFGRCARASDNKLLPGLWGLKLLNPTRDRGP